mmetsp:Transcript_35469/g.72575  ORF Transcript_35469/g.72575 Transcript_35469/m.72575 type:complete len:136 (-) Transcript_35469:832-1239(-)
MGSQINHERFQVCTIILQFSLMKGVSEIKLLPSSQMKKPSADSRKDHQEDDKWSALFTDMLIYLLGICLGLDHQYLLFLQHKRLLPQSMIQKLFRALSYPHTLAFFICTESIVQELRTSKNFIWTNMTINNSLRQ